MQFHPPSCIKIGMGVPISINLIAKLALSE